MPKAKYEVIEEQGITFFFKYDKDKPELLHIYARHLTSMDDALDVFFNIEPTWNERYNRFESLSDTHGLYWFWRNKQKNEVTVITCFRTDPII